MFYIAHLEKELSILPQFGAWLCSHFNFVSQITKIPLTPHCQHTGISDSEELMLQGCCIIHASTFYCYAPFFKKSSHELSTLSYSL